MSEIPPDAVAELLSCARSWEPGVRLLGDVTAAEIVQICTLLGSIETVTTRIGDEKPSASFWEIVHLLQRHGRLRRDPWATVRRATGVMSGAPADSVQDCEEIYDEPGSGEDGELEVCSATRPKLRSRTVVDAEIVEVARIWSGSRRPPDEAWLLRLCAEPTAPEPER